MTKKLFIYCFVGLLFSCQHNQVRNTANAVDDGNKTPINCQSDTRRKIRKDLYVPPANGAIRVAFFDADSTLRISPGGSLSANTPTDVRILPNVGRLLANVHKQGYLIYIVSNQNGVGSGIIGCDVADGALQYTVSEIFKAGGVVHGYDFAENADENRKPGIGMFKLLEANLKAEYGQKVFIDKVQSFMVGDSAFRKKTIDSSKPEKNYEGDVRLNLGNLTWVMGTHFSNADRLFAQAAGVFFYEATDFFGWRKYGIDVLEKSAQVDAFLKKCTDCTP